MPKIKNVFVYKPEQLPDDYSAMRGPCPEGFHVPSRTEIDNLRWMMVQLGLGTIAAYWSKLFIPPCSHMSITYQGTNNWISHSTGWISLWTCNASGERAENLFCYSTDTWPNMIRIQKVVASHIRPFKDGYVQPTASWTVMEGTLWSAWVFWNQTDWIISITTDWTTGCTIADKHLWATTVYSSWATLSGANCWKLFQWGNNYWFSYDHNNVVDSTTQVNVDNYWPWNYYSSSTFTAPIYWWNRFYDWALNANDNLRWWVTWVIPWWTALVEKEVYPGLPSEYQKVEYIQSSGTQYIDTWISANQYLSFEIDFTALWSTQDTNLFGARTGSTSNRFWLTIYNNLFHFMVGNTGTWNTTVDTNRHQASVFLNNWNFTSNFDWITGSGSVWTSVYVNKNFYLFKIDYSNQAGCPMKLYYFKLYTDSSTLVRDFVPCYRKSDWVIWLYDRVWKQFYTNQWSGTFTKWPNI